MKDQVPQETKQISVVYRRYTLKRFDFSRLLLKKVVNVESML